MQDIEDRLLLNEATLIALHDDIQQIKQSLRWVTGLVFTLNVTMLAILMQGFGVV